eukprot:5631028-Pleurochrysis_carterae.AAC.2
MGASASVSTTDSPLANASVEWPRSAPPICDSHTNTHTASGASQKWGKERRAAAGMDRTNAPTHARACTHARARAGSRAHARAHTEVREEGSEP